VNTDNNYENRNCNLNSQSSSSFNEWPKNTCRQAKVIKSFRSPLNNNEFNYLNLQTDTYILVRGQIDENWLNVETFNGESGIFPAKYVEYLDGDGSSLDQNQPILNRTQRKFTLGSEDMPALSYYETTHSDKENIQEVFPKYCKVDYDFQPLSQQDLGCLRGEYLQINEIIGEWYNCTNQYSKIGNVPYNYVTILDKALGKDLFENQKKTINIQVPQTPNIYMNTLDVPSTVNNLSKSDSSLVNMNKNYRPHSDSSEVRRDSVSSTSTQSFSKNPYNPSIALSSNSMSKLSPLLTHNINKVSEEQLNKFFNSNKPSKETIPKITTPLISNQPKNLIKPPIPPKPKFFPKEFENNLSVTNPFYENHQLPSNQLNSSSKIEDKMEQRRVQRKLTILELVETERAYCNQIETFYSIFNDQSIVIHGFDILHFI
jgi:hypothetical protein